MRRGVGIECLCGDLEVSLPEAQPPAAVFELECPPEEPEEEDFRLRRNTAAGGCATQLKPCQGLSGESRGHAALNATVPRGRVGKGRFGCGIEDSDATRMRLWMRRIGGSRMAGATRANRNMGRGRRLRNRWMTDYATHAARGKCGFLRMKARVSRSCLKLGFRTGGERHSKFYRRFPTIWL
jgi:hypothetical protein